MQLVCCSVGSMHFVTALALLRPVQSPSGLGGQNPFLILLKVFVCKPGLAEPVGAASVLHAL